MKQVGLRIMTVGLVLAFVGAVRAADQVWNDVSGNNTWSTNDLNWDAGVAWGNGNNAFFAGTGGLGKTVDISNAVSVVNITFQTSGYVIADADNNGMLTLAGGPSVVTVVGAGATGTVSEVLAGSGGLTKAGNGVLNLTGTNTYSGATLVSSGIVRLAPGVLQGLGATGTGNETVVAPGATLDVNSAYSGNVNEDFTIQGAGVGGIGALVNTGPTDYYNVGYRNLTLTGDATIGVYRRFDMSGSGTYYGNGYTLTKSGGAEMAIGRAVNNSPIVISAGTYTIQNQDALGSTDYPTTLNGTGKLQAWGSYTIAERLIINGGTISSSGDRINTFKLTGNMTLNSNVVFQTDVVPTNTLELAGVLDGAGGFTRSGSGFVVISGDANTYSGPSTVSSGAKLWVGRTVGGTGVLGTGTSTNNGTLYANSAVLSAGTVVNNNSGSLYLNPPTLTVGQIVNLSGTVYGTSVVQAANGVVNASTWNSYCGSFGSCAVTNTGTLNLYTNQLVYGQFANGGTLSLWQSMTLSNPITFIGGSLYVNDLSNTLYVTGPVTLAGNASFSGTASSTTEVSSVLSGPGGIIRAGDGFCYIVNDANDYTGPTLINAGKSLWVGKPGVLTTGRLGTGAITNNGNLYLDHAGNYVTSKGFNGSGNTYTRYGANVICNGGVSTNSIWRIGQGSLTLTNGALFSVPGELVVADRINVGYPSAPTNILAIVNVTDGCTLTPASITFGNGPDIVGGSITGILNQVGGLVRTTANTAEDNGIRLGHYPQARSFYNMMGGTLIVDKDWDLGCATDGQGWFNMTGGAVYAKRVMLNERDNAGGYGRLTVSGGVMNLGSLSGSALAASNGITADLTAPYLVEFGGAGGVIRAVTNIFLPLNATLYGTNANAITFDTTNFAINLSGKLTGAGGLSKTGSGSLQLTGTNTYSGGTAVKAGTLTVAARVNVPDGALNFGVSANGTCGVLHAAGDLSLTGLSVGIVNPEQLDKSRIYTVITYGGSLSGTLSRGSLPASWYVYYDWGSHAVKLRASSGTLIRLY